MPISMPHGGSPAGRGSAGLRAVRCVAQSVLLLAVCVRGYIPSKSCFQDPSQVSCGDADIYYPSEDVQADVATICAMLPAAAGCSVRRMCDAGLASGTYCQPWSLLADVCGGAGGGEAVGHANCKGYEMLCNVTKTVVKQCASRPAVPGLVPARIAQDSVAGLCAMMPDMQACSECAGAQGSFSSCPDPLLSYASICLSMQMDGCEAWRSMCATAPEGLAPFCGAAEEASCSGVMQMYFHTGMHDFVLFKSWVPCTPQRYAGACLFAVGLSVFVAFLKAVRVRIEHRFLRVSVAREQRKAAGGGGGSGGAGGRGAAVAAGSGASGVGRETGRLAAGLSDGDADGVLSDGGGQEGAGSSGRPRVRARRHDTGSPSEAPLLAPVNSYVRIRMLGACMHACDA